MAGGRGLRLHPLTESTPKPLLTVGRKPIIETIIDGFADQGFRKFTVGALWALGVAAEVGIFLIMHRLMRRFALARVLFVSLLLAVLRWLIIALCGADLWWLVPAQLLHAASYGSFHAASIAWVQDTFGEAHAGQGQALYSSLGYGAGWALGAGLSGLYWARWGADSFLVAAATAAVAALVVWRWLLNRRC